MKQGLFRITSNNAIAGDVYEMKLSGDSSAITAPGQFVNIRLEGKFLRRPISVCDWDENGVTLIYKTVGEGTEYMATMRPGQELDLLSGLGNGYDISCCGANPLLIGGGVGLPPLYALCKKLISLGVNPSVIMGFNTAQDVFYYDRFTELGIPVELCTADGSLGKKGFVTDLMVDFEYSYIYTCGPLPMFRAIARIAQSSGQFSFEERMGCGFGACMGCSCQTIAGNKRICKEGPVLRMEEIIWT